MKNILFIGFLLSIPFFSFAQISYYQVGEGKVLDNAAYQKFKMEKLDKMRDATKNKKMDIIETFTVLRQNQDSIINSYSWHVTDNVKKTQAEIDSKQGLVGSPFPFETLGLEKEINTEKITGKPTLINLWFVGCAPCVDEMPILNGFKESYGDSINFIALSYSSDKAVKKFLQKHAFLFEHYTDVKELAKKLNITSFPTNILVDKNGNVVEVMGGIPYTLDKETKKMKIGDGKELKEKLDKLLADN